jgi:hypothetical protein
MAKCRRWRREPLEQSRDGLVEGHFNFYFSAKRAWGIFRYAHFQPERTKKEPATDAVGY